MPILSYLLHFYSQAIIDENVQWNEEIGEWQLKCVAYTGNNMRKVKNNDIENVSKLI